MISFAIPGEPVPWARHMGGRTKVPFTPEKQRDHMALIRAAALEAMRGYPPVGPDYPVELMATFFRKMPQSWSKAKRERALVGDFRITRGDLSNFIKLIEDALIGVVFENDVQVVGLHGAKGYALEPRTVVTIIPANGWGSRGDEFLRQEAPEEAPRPHLG